MRLYHIPQTSPKMGLRNIRERHHCWTVPPRQVTESPQQEVEDFIQPRKLPNLILASHQHRTLHQELLFCHRRGLLPRKKPELQCVLEQRQREQHKQRDLRSTSDLDLKLRTRQQRIQLYELEEKRSERLQNVPEFVRMKGTLKHNQTFS